MTQNKNITGHLSALTTILIWGTTFISTIGTLHCLPPPFSGNREKA